MFKEFDMTVIGRVTVLYRDSTFKGYYVTNVSHAALLGMHVSSQLTIRLKMDHRMQTTLSINLNLSHNCIEILLQNM